MIRSVVREYHFTPDIIDCLFTDSIDYKGLEFWYDDCVQMNKEMKKDKK